MLNRLYYKNKQALSENPLKTATLQNLDDFLLH